MSLVAIAVVVILVQMAFAQHAYADRVIEVDGSAVPFDPDELAAALRIRVPADGGALHVRVITIDGGVRIEVGTRVRDVALAGLRGAAAARLVAMAASDLLLDEVGPTLEPAVRPVAIDASEPRLDKVAHESKARAPSARALTVLGSVAAWERGLVGASVDVAVARDMWLAALEVGGGATAPGDAVKLLLAMARLCGGVRLGDLELRAGATIAPVVATTGSGDTTVLVGGGASVRLRLPLGAGVRGVVAGGIDAFATRTRYELAGVAAAATPWVAPWVAIGVEVAL